MKILIGCEESGIVCNEFRKLGHDVFSCDILPTRGNPKWHLQADVLTQLHWPWDMGIFFPPCTRLCVSGSRHFKRYQKEQVEAFEFFMRLALCEIPRIAIENPVGVMSTRWRKPDQTFQPWEFGHPENKRTCLWLKGLPPLRPTKNVFNLMKRLPKRLANRIHHMAPGPNRGLERSVTYLGIAQAMASQWGKL